MEAAAGSGTTENAMAATPAFCPPMRKSRISAVASPVHLTRVSLPLAKEGVDENPLPSAAAYSKEPVPPVTAVAPGAEAVLEMNIYSVTVSPTVSPPN